MPRLLLALLATSLLRLASAQPVAPNAFNDLHWRLIGPFRGGRAVAVCGVPGHPETFLFGAVGGGVWKSENAGRTWLPIFDKVHTASIGAVAVAPSDPSVIYVGTGEADMRSDIQQGDGMYKSTDGGRTWSHIGLEDTRQIGKILIDPKNPDTVYVAALGHQYGPNPERGVFKTTDGGKTWDKVLYKDENVGAIDMDMDPADSNVIYASLWSTRRPPWSIYPPSIGPGGGLFKSTDAGRTWSQIKGGFAGSTGRIGVCVSPSQPHRVYACVDSPEPDQGGVYRSDDGGATWAHAGTDPRIWGRGWYFCGITCDPKNPDKVYVMNTSTYRSTDGGKNWTAIKGAPGGDDYHTMWIEPNDPDKMILGSDQGVVVSVDGAKTWSSWYNQPTGQFYHVITDSRFPYWVYGSQQDSGAMAVPSRTIHTGISGLDWRPIDAGGESGTIAPDPLHPGTLLSSTGGEEELETGLQRSIDPTLQFSGTVWRSEWTQPIAGSPLDPKVFYTSHQQIFRTGDGGASWTIISPDLTRPKDEVPSNLDPATAADHDGTRNGVVYWIAPSPVKAHQIWAGTDDGLVWLTQDEGAHWTDVTPPELTPWSKVGIIDASHFNAETAYVAIDRHRLDDNRPYIYKTHDLGKHWALITNGIPDGEFVNVVREDPERPGLLYAGTDWGVFVSFDEGDHWHSLALDMPGASIRDLVFQNGDIVAGTHGRSIYILDDASRLRQLKDVSGSTLFKPHPAVLFQRAGTFGFGQFNEGTPLPPEEPQGDNPAWGAVLDYYLDKASPQVAFTIADSSGRIIRKLSSADRPARVNRRGLDIPDYWIKPVKPISSEAGGHRLLWDLHYQSEGGPMVPPGAYTVTMTLGGKSYSQPLRVERDPRVSASDADLRAQFEFALRVEEETARSREARSKAEQYLQDHGSSLTDDQREKLMAVLGGAPGRNRSSTGPPRADVDSLGFLVGAFGNLERAVESAPGAPTSEYRKTFEVLKQREAADLAALHPILP